VSSGRQPLLKAGAAEVGPWSPWLGASILPPELREGEARLLAACSDVAEREKEEE